MKFFYVSACIVILAVGVGAFFIQDQDTSQDIVERIISETKTVEKREVGNERQNFSDGGVKNISTSLVNRQVTTVYPWNWNVFATTMRQSLPIPQASSGCPNGFSYIPGLPKFYNVVFNTLSWTDARRNCKALHPKARLLVIRSKHEQDSIVSSLLNPMKNTIDRNCMVKHRVFDASYIAIWTAGQRVTTSPQSDDWAWKPDAWYEMGYSAWMPGEPNNFRNEESCMILMHGQFGWNDEECQTKTCSICEVDFQ